MTLKKSFVVLKTTYVRWLLSSRLLIFAFAYMFFYVYFIEPLICLSQYPCVSSCSEKYKCSRIIKFGIIRN